MKFFQRFSFKKLINNKRYSLLLSVVIAFGMWLIITINQKPTMTRTFSDVAVNVNLENTYASENSMSIIGDISEQKFTVVIQGPNYVVSSLNSSDLGLYASAATVVEPGNYTLDVAATATTANAEYEIISISPQTINIDFDYIDTREFTIVANAEGATASEGLIAETGVVSGAESDTVTIKGPRMILNKISSVVAMAKVNKTLSQSETFDADIVLLDDNNEIIDTSSLSLSFSKVKVTVPISKKKTVPVKVAYSNLPENFDASSIGTTLDYPNVTIIGTPETVDKITEVSLSPIDITTISATSNSFDVSAKLPEGVRLIDNIDHFTVKVRVENFAERTITVSRIKYVDLSDGLSANGNKSIKNVKVFGPKSVIDALDEKNAYATVSLADKKAGEHTVRAAISFENNTKIWSIGSYDVTVTVK